MTALERYVQTCDRLIDAGRFTAAERLTALWDQATDIVDPLSDWEADDERERESNRAEMIAAEALRLWDWRHTA